MTILHDAHLEVWQAEVYESEHERSWYRWIDAVEQLLGCSPDGDQAEDGFSMDAFYLLWERGRSPRQAIAEVGKVTFD